MLEELMRDILLDFTVLDACLEKINKPCLVMWGDHDKILDPSCLDVRPTSLSGESIILPFVDRAQEDGICPVDCPCD